MSQGRTISAAMAHYLGEIYRLGGDDSLVPPSELAEILDVSRPAATRMVGRLEQAGMVFNEPYQGVRLTATGVREALREIRYHRMAEAFLVNVMEYGWHEAHDMADALAKVADDEFVDRMSKLAGEPTRCPHGEPIPSKDGVMPLIDDRPLSEVLPPAAGLISRIKTRDEGRLIYLAEIGVMPGQALKVLGKAPFKGPVRILLDREEIVLGADLAARILVTLEDQSPLTEPA